MRTSVATCRSENTIPEIAKIMRDRNVGFLPVQDESGAIIGTVTDRDLVLRVVAKRCRPEDTRAKDILTRELVYCSPDDTLDVAEDLMAKHRVSRIIVCSDPRQGPFGVISLSDIANLEPVEEVARVLREVSWRAPAMARVP